MSELFVYFVSNHSIILGRKGLDDESAVFVGLPEASGELQAAAALDTVGPGGDIRGENAREATHMACFRPNTQKRL